MDKHFLGIDVGGTTIKFGLFNEDNILLKKWNINTDNSENGSKIVPVISNSILDFLNSNKNVDICAIGVAIPGPVINGSIVKKAVNLNWKNEFNISDALKTCMNKNIYVHAVNDANAAIYAEYKIGSGKGYDSIFMTTIGTGIGGALIINDKIVEGMNGGAGEIGHIKIVDKYERKCNCGGIGCLETISAIHGIAWLYEKKMGIKFDDVSIKELCSKAKEGDKIANDTLKESMEYVGKALTIVSEIVEPQCMIIGGGVSNAGEIIINYIKEGYDKYSSMAINKPEFSIAKLGNDAGIYGAMFVAKKMKLDTNNFINSAFDNEK